MSGKCPSSPADFEKVYQAMRKEWELLRSDQSDEACVRADQVGVMMLRVRQLGRLNKAGRASKKKAD